MYSRQLSVFIRVAECGSFSKAAQALYVSSVSVMKQINVFEDEIGVKLFNRSTTGVSLTNAGQVIYRDALKIVQLSEQSIAQAQKLAKKDRKIKEQQIIRIGSSFMRTCKPLLDLWSKVDSESLSLKLRIVPFDDDAENMRTWLRDLKGKLDCFWGPCDLTGVLSTLHTYPCQKAACKIAVPPTHPLSSKTAITMDDLKGETLVMLKHGLVPTTDQIHKRIKAEYPDIHVIETSVYTPQLYSTWSQLGYAVETLDLWEASHPYMKTLSVDWEYEAPIGIVLLHEPNESTQLFIDAILEVVNKKS